MTRVKPGQRKRARAPKVRTGCMTCKIRRIKCDEASPACLRCVSTGRVCDGYETLESQEVSGLGLVRIGVSPGSGQEARSLQFFMEKTLVQIQTFFPDNLWSTSILHMAQDESCIRHALVTLSSYHERYLDSKGQQHRTEAPFALRQYNLAIKDLISSNGESPPLNLLTCLIFICIEILQGNHPSAIGLFRYGYKIIRELRQREARESTAMKTELGRMIRLIQLYFHRLGVQIFVLLGPEVIPELSIDILLSFIRSDVQISTSFSSLTEAREALLELLVAQFVVMAMTTEERASYTSRLEQWSIQWEELLTSLARNGPLSASDRRTAALLELHRLEIKVNMKNVESGYFKRNSMVWDDFMGEYEQMVDLAAVAAGLDDDDFASDQPRFHMEFGVSTPLCAVVGRCRDPVLRRKALSTMESVTVQEGIWSSKLTAQISQRVIEIEEEGRVVRTAEDVPVEARLESLRVYAVSGTRQATIVYISAQGRIEEVFTWK